MLRTIDVAYAFSLSLTNKNDLERTNWNNIPTFFSHVDKSNVCKCVQPSCCSTIAVYNAVHHFAPNNK